MEPLCLLTTPFASSPQQQQQGGQQWLVSFQNKTHVFLLDNCHNVDDLSQEIKEKLSFATGWPVSRLLLNKSSLSLSDDTNNNDINNDHSYHYRHVRVRVQSSLRGGKGGFGTLLRSSARQSGANLTTDFGACRDLQGRRLRHVNDEIKLRKWREAQEAKEKGLTTGAAAESDAMFDTPSGLYNWHLMVPSWADISKKATRKIQRQFQRMQQEDDKIEQEKQEKRAQYERSVTMYVQKGTETSNQVKNNVMNSVKEGLRVQNEKKRKRQEQQQETTPMKVFQNEDRPNSLCALSGDVVVEETKKGGNKSVLQIQSQSDFSTLALFLDKPVAAGKKAEVASILYYEVRLVTGGLAQIGWADMTCQDFHPNSEQGEGVGDDKGSYGYDGSRGLKFHNSAEEVYPQSPWKAGDVVGCQCNLKTGEISYSLNGSDLGVAFTVPVKPGSMLFPGISCNGGEILELHIREEEMEHFPVSNNKVKYIPVHELIAANITDAKLSDVEESEGDKKPEAKEPNELLVESLPEKAKGEDTDVEEKQEDEKKKEPVKVEPLDLSTYDTMEDLEKLGLDRLKGALMAIGVKCG